MTKISRTKSARLRFTGKTSREIERGTWKNEIQSESKKTRYCSSPANQRLDQILAAFINLRAAPYFSFKVKLNRYPLTVTRNISNVIADFHHLLKTHITHHVKKGTVLFSRISFNDFILGPECGQPVEAALVGPSHSYRVTIDIYLIYWTLTVPSAIHLYQNNNNGCKNSAK